VKFASQFDSFAQSYESDLDQALSISGEDKDYFARARIQWVRKRLRDLGVAPRSAMDYGCGIGNGAVLLRELLGVDSVVGLDPSVRMLEAARSRYSDVGIRFLSCEEYSPSAEIDLAYCNGVFHHISPAERNETAGFILRSLRPGGLFAFWENNPWNPGTRWVMSRCAFDRDAVPLSSGETTGLLRAQGFQVLHTDYLFIFPRFLKFVRFLEPRLSPLPFGAQYLVLSRKPASG
jgi:SAM-dependent methyltransferase